MKYSKLKTKSKAELIKIILKLIEKDKEASRYFMNKSVVADGTKGMQRG